MFVRPKRGKRPQDTFSYSFVSANFTLHFVSFAGGKWRIPEGFSISTLGALWSLGPGKSPLLCCFFLWIVLNPFFCCPDWLSNPHAKEDPIDLRLEEFYNGTGSAIPFQRPAVAKLNAWACHAPMAHRWSAGSIVASTVLGTPSWSSTSLITSSWPKLKYWILEQVLLCHDFQILRMEILWPDFRSRWCDTKDGWNRSKFGPIEKFLMYYENIEREKVRGLETRRIALPIVVSFALPRQESHWKLEAACFFWLSRETCWRIVTNT